MENKYLFAGGLGLFALWYLSKDTASAAPPSPQPLPDGVTPKVPVASGPRCSPSTSSPGRLVYGKLQDGRSLLSAAGDILGKPTSHVTPNEVQMLVDVNQGVDVAWIYLVKSPIQTEASYLRLKSQISDTASATLSDVVVDTATYGQDAQSGMALIVPKEWYPYASRPIGSNDPSLAGYQFVGDGVRYPVCK